MAGHSSACTQSGGAKMELHPERQAHDDRAQYQDHPDGRPISSIVRPQVQPANAAAFAHRQHARE